MGLDTINLVLNLVLIGLALWLVIHSRHWKAARQYDKVHEHDKKIDMLLYTTGRLQHDQTELRHEGLESNALIWKELKSIGERLDRMQCPMHNPDCSLNENLWTAEQRAAAKEQR